MYFVRIQLSVLKVWFIAPFGWGFVFLPTASCQSCPWSGLVKLGSATPRKTINPTESNIKRKGHGRGSCHDTHCWGAWPCGWLPQCIHMAFMMWPVGQPQPLGSAGKCSAVPPSCLAYAVPCSSIWSSWESYSRLQVDKWCSGQHVGSLRPLGDDWKLSACSGGQDLSLGPPGHCALC